MSVDPRARALSALARFQVTEATVGGTLKPDRRDHPRGNARRRHRRNDHARRGRAADDRHLHESGVFGDRRRAVPGGERALPRRLATQEGLQSRFGRALCLGVPGFAAAYAEHGVQSTLSLPMISGEVAVGAMNLYAHVPDGFNDDDEAVGMDLAGAAGSVLSNVSAYWTAFDLSQNLNEAMKTRAVIEQAKGMIMARSPGLTADDAFDVLRKASSGRTSS